MLERLLTRKVEAWVVLVVALLGLVSTLLFAVLIGYYQSGGKRLGILSPVALGIVETPATLRALRKSLDNPNYKMVAKFQPDGPGGMSRTLPPDPAAPYLLLNRYDGDLGRSVSELVDLAAGDTVHRWSFDVDDIWRASAFASDVIPPLNQHAPTARFRNIHAHLDAGGGLVTQGMGTPLVRFDLCNGVEWVLDDNAYHHSIEVGPQGTYWVPVHLEPKTVDIRGRAFVDDGIAEISADGTLLRNRSVTGILRDNGLGHLVFGGSPDVDDPIHLNDIQPVFEDGAVWRRGDLWLSLRNLSMVLLYRPSTDKVIWYRMGPWWHQHDVNVLDDRRISVFDNAARPGDRAKLVVDGVSGLWIVDVTTGDTSPSHAAGFAALDTKADTQGRARLLPGGRLFFEDAISGRAVIMDAAGDMVWQFINRASDGKVYVLNWSRIVDRDTGDAVRALVDGGACARE